MVLYLCFISNWRESKLTTPKTSFLNNYSGFLYYIWTAIYFGNSIYSSVSEGANPTCRTAREAWILALLGGIQCFRVRTNPLLGQIWSEGGPALQGREEGLIQTSRQTLLVGAAARNWRCTMRKQTWRQQRSQQSRQTEKMAGYGLDQGCQTHFTCRATYFDIKWAKPVKL